MKKFLSLFLGISIILSISAVTVFALEYTKNVKIKIRNTSSSAYTNIYDVNGNVQSRLITLVVEQDGDENSPEPYYYTCSMLWWPDQKVSVSNTGGGSSYHYADVYDGVRSMGIGGTVTGPTTQYYTITNPDY